MTTASQAVNTFLKYIGTTEHPNGSNCQIFGERYGFNCVAWCDISFSEIIREASGSYTIAGGKFAYTVSHANRFVQMGRWGHTPQLGAAVFYDWQMGRDISGIDHIEMVRGAPNAQGLLPTVGGNTQAGTGVDGVWAALRDTRYVVGYGYPLYSSSPTPAPQPASQPVVAVDGGFGPNTVTALQFFLNRTLKAGLATDGGYGPLTKKALQRWVGTTQDGDVGPVTVRALQHKVGTTADGSWGPNTTRALQSYLNAHRS